MKKMLVVLLLAALAAPVAFAAGGPEEVKFDTKMGTVTFDHAGHQEIESDCTSCHHMGMDSGTCKDCHGVDDAAPKAKDAFHDLCTGCHKDQGAGPTKCKECHVR